MHGFSSTDTIISKNNSTQTRKVSLICGIITLLVGFLIGILVGRFATCPEQTSPPKEKGVFLEGVSERIIQDADPEISQLLMDGIKPENMRTYLRDLTELPHLAGTDADYRQAKELEDFWKASGLDKTFITPYDVLLSYPNVTDDAMMNRIEVWNASGDIIYSSPLREPILHPSENKSGVVPPFNAYAHPGDINSERLVYVNYGRIEDYRLLQSNFSHINLTDAIVIARYGKIFRGDKVRLATTYGAKGIIMYSDPADYTDNGDTSNVYPHDWWLPSSGAQRGTIFLGTGDPLTPGYPATEKAYRLNESDPKTQLPTIPAHPVGYGIGQKILEQMGGDEVPEDWKGKLNITYRLGGPLKNAGWKIRMFISTKNEVRRIYNVFGIIRGAIEPDRYVILGNHRDAWVFGAIDPSSGTAVMKEISRVMGDLVKRGRWRPRRTIIFCSWGAEEYGLLGSTEWVEHYVKNLAERSIAYLNVDLAIFGNYSLFALSTPLLHKTIIDASKKVPNPNPDDVQAGMITVFDKWIKTFPISPQKPYIAPLGGGSDHATFVQFTGIPSISFAYTYNMNKYQLGSYPLYHSVYETFYAVDEIIDKGFKHHQAVGRVWVEMARDLSDSLVIPFDVTDFASNLLVLVRILDTDFGKLLRVNGVQFEWLWESARNFSDAANGFNEYIKTVNKMDPFSIRKINDQLMLMERAFLNGEGLPGRPFARHILFAESSVDSYSGSSFPGLVDSLFEIEKAANQEERWNVVKRHFSVILFSIQSAESTLREVTQFMPDFKKD